MNRQGQIYILAAILFGFVLFVLTSKTNYVAEKIMEDNFKELSENYAIESSKFVNSLLEDREQEISTEFEDFSKNFEEFAKDQNPDFRLIYLFPYKGNIYVNNYFDREIKIADRRIRGCGEPIEINAEVDEFAVGGEVYPVEVGIQDCKTYIPAQDKINIIIEDRSYDFELNKDVPEIIILSKEDKDGQRKVFMNNKIISGSIIKK